MLSKKSSLSKIKPSVFLNTDFTIGALLGEGAFSKVYAATHKKNKEQVAIKMSDYQHYKENKLERTVLERLSQKHHPNIIHFYGYYETKEHMCFVLELADGGCLFDIIDKYGPCSVPCAQFYAAELINALEYIHSQGVIHRDIKPENVLLTKDRHLKLSDFGTGRILSNYQNKEDKNVVGTCEYVAPELIVDGSKSSVSSDLWSLGCVIYFLLTGKLAFFGQSEYLVFQKIKNLEYSFSDTFPSPEGKDLIQKLLKLNPEERLGVKGYSELKSHAFFKGINFETLHKQTPPSLPNGDKHLQEQNLEKFLLKNEKAILTGVVIKRRRLSTKKRQLVLTDFPRLFYLSSRTAELKGEIPFSTDLRVEAKGNNSFVVYTLKRSWHFDVDGDVEVWTSAIKKMLEQYSSDTKIKTL